MSKVKEILRLRWAMGRSVREAARAIGASHGAVSKTENRARRAGLTWSAVEAMEEVALDRVLHGGARHSSRPDRAEPDPVEIHLEMRRPGVTLDLLHLEYLAEHPEGYRYTAFCDRYRAWLAKQGVVMRQVHRAGEKGFVDYSGRKPWIVDPTTGEAHEVELFVAVLGASNYTYAEATATQRIGDFLGSHVRAFAFFGGVPSIMVPDQLRSAVRVPSRHEPVLTRSYAELGRHYGTAIVPARPGKPRDKAKVEVAVQVAQRWIVARLRNETFFSIGALNARIGELLDELNRRPMKGFGGASRRDLFERFDRAALLPLPDTAFVLAEWRNAKVGPDYHVAIEDHYYSAPYVFVSEEVEARLTATTVEIYVKGSRVAAHVRSYEKYKHTTETAHMPEAHRAVFEAGDAISAWAASIGPMTAALVQRILGANPFREVGWRSAKGLQRVAAKHGPDRTEAACAQAVRFGARSYKPVQRILELGRERTLCADEPEERAAIQHENVRGPDYYH
ncbi:MAG: IS21 family transposase [Deltaproteobacteria bacterium]|nr:IS21 family transposase [Deltaproteobacteria bacterium]